MFDRLHAPVPITPADGVFFAYAYEHGITAACRALALPSRCLARRINTYPYLALVPEPVPPDEAEARGQQARERLAAAMGCLMEAWNAEYLPEIKGHLAAWEAFDLPGAPLPRLVAHLAESMERTKRLYEIHMLVVFPLGYTAISMFDDLYHDLLGGDGAPLSGAGGQFDAFKLLQGFPNKTVECGRALWQLSRRALASPVVHLVLAERAAAEVVPVLESSPEGLAFLAELRTYLEAYGERGETWGWSYPSWIEDPTPVIKNLKDYVGQPDRDLEAEMAALAAERERLVAAARERLSTRPAAVREQFEFLLKAAQEASVLSEDHGFWIDFRCAYQVRRVFLELGRRFAAAGVLDTADDVFCLTPDEIAQTAAALPRHHQRALAAARRAEMAYFRTITPPAALGSPPQGPPPEDPISRAVAKFF
jgi:pyruvate,water dikinase